MAEAIENHLGAELLGGGAGAGVWTVHGLGLGDQGLAAGL